MTTPSSVISSKNLSHAWAEAMLFASAMPGREAVPLVVSVDVSGGVMEDPPVRQALDDCLRDCDLNSVRTVASTIFPSSLWHPGMPANELYDRYDRIWPRIRRVRANSNGTYFRRMTSFGADEGGINQLAHVLDTWRRGNHRRSALQLALFDPQADHTHQRQRGFPCLHQVSIVPEADGGLSLTGLYSLQLLFEKAYGNYLGLAALGRFVASEFDRPLKTVTCVASVAKVSQAREFGRERREVLEESLRDALGEKIQ